MLQNCYGHSGANLSGCTPALLLDKCLGVEWLHHPLCVCLVLEKNHPTACNAVVPPSRLALPRACVSSGPSEAPPARAVASEDPPGGRSASLRLQRGCNSLDKRCWPLFDVFICHPLYSLVKSLFFSCQFFFFLSLENSLYILNRSPLLDICFTNIFLPICSFSCYSLNLVF